jgi:hypothetical protein
VGLQGFLGRNGYPYTLLDANKDEEGRAVIERLGVLPKELPLVLCPNGTILKRPTEAEAGACLGITRRSIRKGCMMWRSWARGLPVLPPQSMPGLNVCLCSCSKSAPLAARLERRPASRTILAKVKRLRLVVRGPGLEASMSRYLIERIAALSNVALHTGTEVTGLEGNETMGLAAATFHERASGESHVCPLRHLFLFIGADPNASWLKGCVDADSEGFVITGGDGTPAMRSRPILPLETSRRGVFAINDVRAGSTKRVAAAVGEGAAVVAQIHSVLAQA